MDETSSTFPKILSRIESALTSGQFKDLLELCELAELLAAEEPHSSDADKVEIMQCCHVLACLREHDLSKAKYLFRRLSEGQDLKPEGALQTLHDAYVARWSNNNQLFFAKLTHVGNEASHLAPLVNEVIKRQRDLILNNIEKTYSKITTENLLKALAASPEDVKVLTATRGWTYDNNGFAMPNGAKVTPDAQRLVDDSLADQLARITQLMGFLEKNHGAQAQSSPASKKNRM